MSETKERRELPPKLEEASGHRVWKKLMKLHFIKTKTWNIVTGVEIQPTDDATDSDLQKFVQKEARAYSDLVACLKGNIKSLAVELDTV